MMLLLLFHRYKFKTIVSNTGSLLSMEDSIPRRKVFVKDDDWASREGETGIAGPGNVVDIVEACCTWDTSIGGDRAGGGDSV